jgi:hypothetical protein
VSLEGTVACTVEVVWPDRLAPGWGWLCPRSPWRPGPLGTGFTVESKSLLASGWSSTSGSTRSTSSASTDSSALSSWRSASSGRVDAGLRGRIPRPAWSALAADAVSVTVEAVRIGWTHGEVVKRNVAAVQIGWRRRDAHRRIRRRACRRRWIRDPRPRHPHRHRRATLEHGSDRDAL